LEQAAAFTLYLNVYNIQEKINEKGHTGQGFGLTGNLCEWHINPTACAIHPSTLKMEVTGCIMSVGYLQHHTSEHGNLHACISFIQIIIHIVINV
jgi:hypothetical protein